MTAFTKGLWNVQPNQNDHGDSIAICCGSHIIALIPPEEEALEGEWSAEDKANANLISASPDMHDAIWAAERTIERLHSAILGHHATSLCDSKTLVIIANESLKTLSELRAARGKAEGRPI